MCLHDRRTSKCCADVQHAVCLVRTHVVTGCWRCKLCTFHTIVGSVQAHLTTPQDDLGHHWHLYESPGKHLSPDRPAPTSWRHPFRVCIGPSRRRRPAARYRFTYYQSEHTSNEPHLALLINCIKIRHLGLIAVPPSNTPAHLHTSNVNLCIVFSSELLAP